MTSNRTLLAVVVIATLESAGIAVIYPFTPITLYAGFGIFAAGSQMPFIEPLFWLMGIFLVVLGTFTLACPIAVGTLTTIAAGQLVGLQPSPYKPSYGWVAGALCFALLFGRIQLFPPEFASLPSSDQITGILSSVELPRVHALHRVVFPVVLVAMPVLVALATRYTIEMLKRVSAENGSKTRPPILITICFSLSALSFIALFAHYWYDKSFSFTEAVLVLLFARFGMYLTRRKDREQRA